jgi:NDMA-dependent alcohol dehydrogenase
MKTKGAILWGVDQDWSVEEIEVGDPVAGEVQVRLAASGMCHSDEHLRTGDTPVPSYPVLGGHEGAGIVTKVGAGVSDVAEGDHVVLAFIPACGTCLMCSTGRSNICDKGANLLTGQAISDSTFRVTAKGQGAIPMCLLGTFSPYVTVNQASVVKIENQIPLDKAALVGCGVTTGWGSAVKVADTRPGDTVVVIGIGGVGINAIQGAAAAGASIVVAVDPVAFKRDSALKLGATHAYATVEEAAGPLGEATYGRMAEKVIITIGRTEGHHVLGAQSLVGKGGRIVVTGMGDFADVDVKLNLAMFTLLQQDLQGAIFGGSNPRADIPRLLKLYEQGVLKLDELITQTYRLEDINQGYADMREGKNLRGVILYDDADY